MKVAPSRALPRSLPCTSWAWSSAASVPWNTLLMNAGPPPLRNCSVWPTDGIPLGVPSWLDRNMYWHRSVNGSPSGCLASWCGSP